MQSIGVAIRGKGIKRTLKRANDLRTRYGFSPGKIERQLNLFVKLLNQYQCGATFPITSVVLERNQETIGKYKNEDIEFAVHGYYHKDQTQLSSTEQESDFIRAKELFQKNGLRSLGFRSPYLRANKNTLEALKRTGYMYDGSPAVFFDVTGKYETESYQKALDFYQAVPSSKLPVLPYWENGLLRIPYCLPDDEALVERIRLNSEEIMSDIWLSMLAETYRFGELFTLGLHPERTSRCQKALSAVLKTARSLFPKVWIARLDDIANWWLGLKKTRIAVTESAQNHLTIKLDGPNGISLYTRGVDVLGPSLKWNDRYRIVDGNELNIHCEKRPFIGVPNETPISVINLLRQQGYIIEQTNTPEKYSYFIDRVQIYRENERSLVNEIENGDFPIVKIGRWPHGAQSALSVTGDIDAVTLYDYGLRLIGF